MPETIYDALRESHEIQRSLCRKLLRAKPGTHCLLYTSRCV